MQMDQNQIQKRQDDKPWDCCQLIDLIYLKCKQT